MIIISPIKKLVLDPELSDIVTKLIERGFGVAQPTKDVLDDESEPWDETNYFEIFDPNSTSRMFSLHQFVHPITITIDSDPNTGKLYDSATLLKSLRDLGIYNKTLGSPPKNISGQYEIMIADGELSWYNKNRLDKSIEELKYLGRNFLMSLIILTTLPYIAQREIKDGWNGRDWNPFYGTQRLWKGNNHLPSSIAAVYESLSQIIYWPTRGISNLIGPRQNDK